MIFVSKRNVYHVILEGGQIITDPSGTVLRTVAPLKVIFKDGLYETKDPSIIRRLLKRAEELREKGMFVGYTLAPRSKEEEELAKKYMEESAPEDKKGDVSAELEALREQNAVLEEQLAAEKAKNAAAGESKKSKGESGSKA